MTTVSIFSAIPRHIATLAMATGLLFSAGASCADDAVTAAPTKTERCLQLNRIRQTKVVDDKTVLFYLTQTEIYKNVLPHKCGSLRNDEAFLYKSSINQLCSVDTITPLISTGGGYMATTNCGLGSFELIDKAVADKLIANAKTARTAGN